MDYRHVVEALRAKARDKAVGPEEADALNAKADELAKRYLKAPAANPVFTVTHVQYSYQQAGAWVTKEYDFPDDWYVTADEWWNWDTGSMAE